MSHYDDSPFRVTSQVAGVGLGAGRYLFGGGGRGRINRDPIKGTLLLILGAVLMIWLPAFSILGCIVSTLGAQRWMHTAVAYQSRDEYAYGWRELFGLFSVRPIRAGVSTLILGAQASSTLASSPGVLGGLVDLAQMVGGGGLAVCWSTWAIVDLRRQRAADGVHAQYAPLLAAALRVPATVFDACGIRLERSTGVLTIWPTPPPVLLEAQQDRVSVSNDIYVASGGRFVLGIVDVSSFTLVPAGAGDHAQHAAAAESGGLFAGPARVVGPGPVAAQPPPAQGPDPGVIFIDPNEGV